MSLKEKFACSDLTSPTGGVCYKVLVPPDYLQASGGPPTEVQKQALQETLLPKQDLDQLNSVHDDFYGESTTDLSLGIICGRIPRGVDILVEEI